MAVKVRMGEKEILQSMKQAVVMLMMAQEEDDEGSDEDEDEDEDDDDENGDGKPADVLNAQMPSCFSIFSMLVLACGADLTAMPDHRLRWCSVCTLLLEQRILHEQRHV